jgi:CHAT domain-containing protein
MFKEIADKYDVIHIASHGIADKNDYRNSGIFFSNSDGALGLNESFYSLNEIYDLKTQANLVVLSACKTSVGEVAKGEGVMALPRGFIYAGVPNVIASLWKVHDEKTKNLMVSFYKHLLEDKVTYAEALRRAKLDCINNGFMPIDWAGFILIGK